MTVSKSPRAARSTAGVAKVKKVSKKQIAAALESLKSGGQVASVKDFPAWLIPILLDMAKNFLEKQTA